MLPPGPHGPRDYTTGGNFLPGLCNQVSLQIQVQPGDLFGMDPGRGQGDDKAVTGKLEVLIGGKVRSKPVGGRNSGIVPGLTLTGQKFRPVLIGDGHRAVIPPDLVQWIPLEIKNLKTKSPPGVADENLVPVDDGIDQGRRPGYGQGHGAPVEGYRLPVKFQQGFSGLEPAAVNIKAFPDPARIPALLLAGTKVPSGHRTDHRYPGRFPDLLHQFSRGGKPHDLVHIQDQQGILKNFQAGEETELTGPLPFFAELIDQPEILQRINLNVVFLGDVKVFGGKLNHPDRGGNLGQGNDPICRRQAQGHGQPAPNRQTFHFISP